MIPKVIHYCWFGGKPLPETAIKCISSWKKYLPNYEIKEWNENNFDLTLCDYVKEAYEEKKWAFVSDYARFWILYKYGGIYFDTDVEVIKEIGDIVEKGSFMGCEFLINVEDAKRVTDINSTHLGVNTGLGLGAIPGLKIYEDILEFYQNIHFRCDDGELITTTVVEYVSKILRKYNWKGDGTIECIEGVYIYPPEFFCPLNYCTGKLKITQNTRTIHWYSSTWFTRGQKLEKDLIQFSSRFGKTSHIVERILTFPVRIWNKFRKLGVKKTVKFAMHKFFSKL